MRQRTFVAGVGEEFSNEQNILKIGSGVESFRIARTVGYETEPSESFTRIGVIPPGKTLATNKKHL